VHGRVIEAELSVVSHCKQQTRCPSSKSPHTNVRPPHFIICEYADNVAHSCNKLTESSFPCLDAFLWHSTSLPSNFPAHSLFQTPGTSVRHSVHLLSDFPFAATASDSLFFKIVRTVTVLHATCSRSLNSCFLFLFHSLFLSLSFSVFHVPLSDNVLVSKGARQQRHFFPTFSISPMYSFSLPPFLARVPFR
jgi:hypothetical protein